MSDERSNKVSSVNSDAVRTLSSQDVLADARVIAISHADETYRLSVTKQGKLLLTKWDTPA